MFKRRYEISILPTNINELSKRYVSDIVNNLVDERSNTLVLNQPFQGCNPIKSFKYFSNPSAIIVDRDPRDHYLFAKLFLQPKGVGYLIPCENVDDYIRYFLLIRQALPEILARDDCLYIHFEKLIYDYEKAIKQISEFCGVKEHVLKGEHFKPTHSRNNTQLFNKYNGFEEDIEKIENELTEYLFPFEDYPDIEAEGGMFYGNQSQKRK